METLSKKADLQIRARLYKAQAKKILKNTFLGIKTPIFMPVFSLLVFILGVGSIFLPQNHLPHNSELTNTSKERVIKAQGKYYGQFVMMKYKK